MSIQISKLVWQLEINSTMKLVLLYYADLASHDGTNIWPAISTVAKHASLAERTVERVNKKLILLNILQKKGVSKFHTKLYAINVEKIKQMNQRSLVATLDPKDDDIHDIFEATISAQRGDIESPNPLLTNNKPLVNRKGYIRNYACYKSLYVPIKDECMKNELIKKEKID